MQEILKSKWNNKLLPLLLEQDEISLYDIVKLVSTEYISATKYLADFLDYFICKPGNSLNVKQHNLVLKFIQTLKNPCNFNENNLQEPNAFDSFNIKNNLTSEDYIALHEVYWTKENLNRFFIEQDLSLHQFESCFIFGQSPAVTKYTPTYFFQDQFSYFEAACLMVGCSDVIEAKSLYEKDLDCFYKKYRQFGGCFNLLKNAQEASLLPPDNIPSNVLNNYLKTKNMHIPGFTNRDTSLAGYTSIHPALDPLHPNHAPELLIALNAWEAKYMNNEYPYQDHTPSITNILKKQNLTQVNLVKRICAITNPNK